MNVLGYLDPFLRWGFMILGGIFAILVITEKYPRKEMVPLSKNMINKGYTFETHIIETDDISLFDESNANHLLRQIRNTIQVFKRLYPDRELTPDAWHQIDYIDYWAHGGERYNIHYKGDKQDAVD